MGCACDSIHYLFMSKFGLIGSFEPIIIVLMIKLHGWLSYIFMLI